MNLVYGLVLYEFSVAQVDRAPARCLGGHMFECCRRFFFFVPRSWHADHFIFTKKIYVGRKWLKPSEVFSFKGKMNFAALLFFLSAGNKKFQRANATAVRVWCKWIHPTIGWRRNKSGIHKHAHGSWILCCVSRVRSKTMYSLFCITS